MSDVGQGPGWWEASDGKWYPPELHPDWSALGRTGPGVASQSAHGDLASWAPVAPGVPDRSMAGSLSGPFADPAASHWGYPGANPGSDGDGSAMPSVTPAGAGGRFRRGLRLVGVGFAVVRDEPGLMLVPVVAFVAQLAIIGIAALVLLPGIHAFSTAGTGGTYHPSTAQWVVVVVAGVATMWVSVVSHATIISRVTARFHGQEVSNAQAARAALTKSPQLLGWAFINYVVMSVLRNVSNRGIIGLLVGSLLRAGWYLGSFFVVPVILFEDKGAIASIKRSVQLCRGRWGENIVGNGALGVIGAVVVLGDVVVAVVLGAAFVPLGVVVGLIGLVGIVLVLTVATASFNAALYWFAVTGQAPGEYLTGDLQAAYRQKRQRGGLFGM